MFNAANLQKFHKTTKCFCIILGVPKSRVSVTVPETIVSAIEAQRINTSDNSLFSGHTNLGEEGGWYGYKFSSGQTMAIVIHTYYVGRIAIGYHDKTKWTWTIFVQ